MIAIRKIEPPVWIDPPIPTDREGVSRHRIYQPGDAWYASLVDGSWLMFADGPYRDPLTLAPEHAGKRPIIVVLPRHGGAFCVHSPVMREGVYGSHGWKVDGDLENLSIFSVFPSIDMRAIWHGHLLNGQLTP